MSDQEQNIIPGYIVSPHLQTNDEKNDDINHKIINMKTPMDDLNNSQIEKKEENNDQLINIPLISQARSKKEEENPNFLNRLHSQDNNNTSILSEKKFLLDDELITKSPARFEQFLLNVNPKIINLKSLEDVTLNYNQMMEKTNNNRPKTKKNSNAKLTDVFCDIDTGYHWCCGTSLDGDLNKYGIGVALYFKFVKYLAVFFSIFLVFTIPTLVLTFQSSVLSNDLNSYDFKSILMASTIGSLGQDYNICTEMTLNLDLFSTNQSSNFNENTFDFQCSGTLSLNTFQYGLLDPNNDFFKSYNCYYIDESYYDTSCNQESVPISQLVNQCFNQSACSLTINQSFFQQNTNCQQKLIQKNLVILQIQCLNSEIQLFSSVAIKKSYISLIISFLDVVIVLLFFFMVISLNPSIKKLIQIINKDSVSISFFSLEISLKLNLGEKENKIDELFNFLKSELSTFFAIPFEIVDIQIGFPKKVLTLTVRSHDLLIKRNLLIKRFIKLYFPQEIFGDELKIEDFYNMTDKKKNNDWSFIQDLQEIQKLDRKLRLMVEDFLGSEEDPKDKSFGLWVTFETIRQRDLAYEYFSRTPFQRFCERLSAGFSKKDFKSNIIVGEAPDPENIQWDNFEYSGKDKFLRRIFSYILTFLLLVITYISICGFGYLQETILNKKPFINCSLNGLQNLTNDQVALDYNSEFPKGYLDCYCKVDPIGRYDEQFPLADNQYLCQIWALQKLYVTFLSFASAFIIVAINLIIKSIFTSLSKFEKHIYLSTEISSRMLKILFVQFLNTGLLVLIINANFNLNISSLNQFPFYFLFSGKFKDFVPLWYNNVGVTIIITMGLNALVYPFRVMIYYFLIFIQRCWNRRCSCNKKISRCKTQKNYEKMYMGVEFMLDWRYAQVLNIVFICFLFGTALPLLFTVILIHLIIIYFMDKYIFFNFCKIPQKSNEQLAFAAQNLLFIPVMLNLFFSIWTLGNSLIFYETYDDFQQYTVWKNGINDYLGGNFSNWDYLSEFISRSTKIQTFVFTILLIFFLLFLICKYFLYKIVFKCLRTFCEACLKKVLFSKDNKLDDINFYAFLSDQDLEDEMKITRKHLVEFKTFKCKEIYQKKLEKITKELEKRKAQPENKEKNKLSGLFSYSIELNEKYRKCFFDA